MRAIQKLRRLLRSVRKVLILGHHNADPDAVCSAIALRSLLRSVDSKLTVSVAFPEGASKVGEAIVHGVGARTDEKPDFSKYDLFITVDTNTFEQLGEWKTPVVSSGKPIVVIDHHAVHPETKQIAALLLTDEQATSACEVIIQLYREFKRKPPTRDANALFSGIIFETGHLSIGTRRTFENICWLLSLGVDPIEAQLNLRTIMDESERIARLKAAQRLVFERAGKWLIASSELGSFQASAARSLISVGAHVAVVGGDHQGRVSVSYRATRDFHEETGIHLGKDVARVIGERFVGAGGGHPTAAGANISGEPSVALKESAQLIRGLIERPVKS